MLIDGVYEGVIPNGILPFSSACLVSATIPSMKLIIAGINFQQKSKYNIPLIDLPA